METKVREMRRQPPVSCPLLAITQSRLHCLGKQPRRTNTDSIWMTCNICRDSFSSQVIVNRIRQVWVMDRKASRSGKAPSLWLQEWTVRAGGQRQRRICSVMVTITLTAASIWRHRVLKVVRNETPSHQHSRKRNSKRVSLRVKRDKWNRT